MPTSQTDHIFEYCKNGQTTLLLEALDRIDDSRIVDERQNSILACALKNGDWKTTQALIEKDYIYFHPNKPGLISACQCKRDDSEGIQLVLKLGTNIDSQDLQNRTALMTVCLLGHVNKAQELLENRANISLQDVHGNTALMDAAQSKNKNTVNLILKQKPKIDQTNNQGETALIIELQKKSPVEDIVSQLLKAGSNPEVVDNNKKSAWLIAKQKHPKIAKLIETHLNKVNQIELPFFAAQPASPETIDPPIAEDEIADTSTSEQIISEPFNNDNRIEPNLDSIFSKTPENNNPSINENTEPLIGPTISIKQDVQEEHNEHVKEIDSSPQPIDSGGINPNNNKIHTNTESKINSEDAKTIQPSVSKPYVFTKKARKSSEHEWFHAAKTGNLGGLNRMIIEGIDIDCIDKKGCTALIRASGHSRRAVVSFLLQQNASIEARSFNGSTALSSSIIGDCRRVAGLLLENNADVNALGPSNCSYVTIAAAQWNEAMLSILCRHGGDAFLINDANQSLLHIISLAAEYYNNVNKAKTSIQFLLDKGLDINHKDNNGDTALMILCGTHKSKYNVDDRNIASIAHCLIKMGAAAAITNNNGNSALDACKQHKLQQSKGVIMNALSWND